MESLTIKKATELKGTEINIFAPGAYPSQNIEDKIIVGSIMSEFDHAKTIAFEGYNSLADMWADKLPERLPKFKQRMILLDANNKQTYAWVDMDKFNSYNTYLKSINEPIIESPVFNMGDEGRYVSFTIA